MWFTDEAIASWKAEHRTTRGGQPTYPGTAILTPLTLRAVFRLALRQTEGLIGSLTDLLGLDLAVPDHSTLSRRAATVDGPRGSTINVVQPGPVDTDANPANGPMSDMLHGFMAIKRHGRPDEVAAMVAWLGGPEAGFVTGVMHTIDGGFGA